MLIKLRASGHPQAVLRPIANIQAGFFSNVYDKQMGLSAQSVVGRPKAPSPPDMPWALEHLVKAQKVSASSQESVGTVLGVRFCIRPCRSWQRIIAMAKAHVHGELAWKH